ncbi:MAG: ATP-binding protein [Nitrososphaerales archaeon]
MFDSVEELLRKIRLGEDSVLELKSVSFKGEEKIEGPKRDELADKLAAMANTHSGVCVLGIDDSTKEVLGIPVDKLDLVERFLFEICNDLIRPPINVTIIRMELPDTLGTTRPVVKVDVPRSLFVHESPGGYFWKQGSAKRKLPPDVLARLFQQRSQARVIRFDEQPVPETSLKDMDEELWRRFITNIPGDPVSVLRKLRILTQDDNGAERGSVGGVLMCSRHPERWLPGAFIEAVRYRGTRQDSNYQADASQITGPLDKQVSDALAFAKRNMRVAATKAPARQEIPQFSERAIFEAVVNAVAHRDYSIHGSKIRLLMFDERLELYSPGPLPNTVTVDSLSLRQSTRNELLTSLLARCPVQADDQSVGRQFLMEKRGDGVPIILHESEKLSGKVPLYRLIDDTELLLTIYAADLPNQPANASA